MKISATDHDDALALFGRGPSGNTRRRLGQVCQWLVEAGVDAIHVSIGSFFPHPRNPAGVDLPVEDLRQVLRHDDLERRADVRELPAVPRRIRADCAAGLERRRGRARQHRGRRTCLTRAAIKQAVTVPVICTGGFQTASVIRGAIDRGDCDAVSAARPLVANNDLVQMFARGLDARAAARAPTATSASSTSSRTRSAATTRTRFEPREEMIARDHVGLPPDAFRGRAAMTPRRPWLASVWQSARGSQPRLGAVAALGRGARRRRRTTSSRTSSTARSAPRRRSACRIRSGGCCRCSSPTSCRSGRARATRGSGSSSRATRRRAARSARPMSRIRSRSSASTARPATPARCARSPSSPRQIIAGMPAHQMDLQGYANFLTAAARDPRFEAGTLIEAIRKQDPELRLVHVAALPLRRRQADARRHPRARQAERLVRRSSAAGTGPGGHLQPLQADVQLRPEGGHERRHRRPAAAVQPARPAGAVAALGRQQQPGGGAEQERGDRRRRDARCRSISRRSTASRSGRST